MTTPSAAPPLPLFRLDQIFSVKDQVVLVTGAYAYTEAAGFASLTHTLTPGQAAAVE